jgi:hypothetical protein
VKHILFSVMMLVSAKAVAQAPAADLVDQANLAAKVAEVLECQMAGTNSKCATDQDKPVKAKRTITWFDRLNPVFWLGNLDTPVPPADYLPGDQFRVLKWYLRNPGHNFMFYVVGIADKVDDPEFKRYGIHPSRVFAPTPGWNVTYIRYKWVFLPFISYWDENVRFYIGWRERGNLGAKLNRGTTQNP